jgi:hypothetical protein
MKTVLSNGYNVLQTPIVQVVRFSNYLPLALTAARFDFNR